MNKIEFYYIIIVYAIVLTHLLCDFSVKKNVIKIKCLMEFLHLLLLYIHKKLHLIVRCF